MFPLLLAHLLACGPQARNAPGAVDDDPPEDTGAPDEEEEEEEDTADTDAVDTAPTGSTGSTDATDSPGDTVDTAPTAPTGPTGPVDTGLIPGSAAPMLVEIADSATFGNLKYVVVYNPGSTAVDLTGWDVSVYSNGSSTGVPVALDPLGSLAPGALVSLCNVQGASEFASRFGRAPDLESGTIAGNGDDAYALHDDAGRTVDLYGQIGQDGTGTPWEYTDGVAVRNAGVTAPSATWQAGEWTITAGDAAQSPDVR